MLDLFIELRRVAEALDAAGIAYAVVGGLAVSIYTAPRATDDIDLLIAPQDLARAVTDRTERTIDGQRLSIVGIRALRALKRLRASALDRADLEALGPDEP
jgi:hypothetical protein